MSDKEEKSQVDELEHTQKLLQKELRVNQCSAELAKVLEMFNCKLEVSMLLKAGAVIPQIEVIAHD